MGPHDRGPDSYAFAVVMDKKLVDFALKAKQPERNSPWEEQLKADVSQIMGDMALWKYPICWHDSDSCMVRLFDVPGEATHLSLELGDVEGFTDFNDQNMEWVGMSTHNVDTAIRAFALMKAFISWVQLVGCMYIQENSK